jgi:hypothetical protein
MEAINRTPLSHCSSLECLPLIESAGEVPNIGKLLIETQLPQIFYTAATRREDASDLQTSEAQSLRAPL